MLTLNEAVETAHPYLARAFAHEPWTVVVQPQLSEEHDLAWIIRYVTRQRVDTTAAAGPLTTMVLVPKDGAPVRFPPRTSPWASTSPTFGTAAGTPPAWRGPCVPSRGRRPCNGCSPPIAAWSNWQAPHRSPRMPVRGCSRAGRSSSPAPRGPRCWPLPWWCPRTSGCRSTRRPIIPGAMLRHTRRTLWSVIRRGRRCG